MENVQIFCKEYYRYNQYGLLKNGKVFVKPIYDDIDEFDENLFKIKLFNRYGLMDKQSGKIITPIEFDNIELLSGGLAPARKNGKWGYINKNGKTIIEFQFDNCRSFSEGLARACKNGKWGFIDKKGKEVIPFIYDEYTEKFILWDKFFSEGTIQVCQNNKFGVIDKTGKEIVPVAYDDIGKFCDDMAWVKNNKDLKFCMEGAKRYSGKFGYYDKSGNMVIPMIYDYADDFEKGYAIVKKDGKFGVIDKKGEMKLPFIFDYLTRSGDEKFEYMAKYNGKSGFLHLDGKLEIINGSKSEVLYIKNEKQVFRYVSIKPPNSSFKYKKFY